MKLMSDKHLNRILPQFILLHSQSIGHFINDSEILISKHTQAKKNGYRFRYYTQEQISNTFWKDTLLSEIKISNGKIARYAHRLLNRCFSSYRDLNSKLSEVDLEDIPRFQIHHRESRVLFDSTQLEVGEKLLRDLGVMASQKIVALVTRDEGMDSMHGEWVVNEQRYRNTPMNDLVSLVELLTTSGYFVIRMGRNNSKRIPVLRNNFADFSDFCEEWDDWVDFYFFSRASFVMSTASGADHIGVAARKRVYFFNYAPIGTMTQSHLFPFSLASDYLDYFSGEKLSIEEIQKRGLANFSSRDISASKVVKIRGKSAHLIEKFGTLVLEAEKFYATYDYENASIEIEKLLRVWSESEGMQRWRNSLY